MRSTRPPDRVSGKDIYLCTTWFRGKDKEKFFVHTRLTEYQYKESSSHYAFPFKSGHETVNRSLGMKNFGEILREDQRTEVTSIKIYFTVYTLKGKEKDLTTTNKSGHRTFIRNDKRF